ncbi:MAG: hypothetical protein WAL26_28460 [Mycobacterium sp.]
MQGHPLGRLAEDTERRVLSAYAVARMGRLPAADTAPVIAVIVNRANAAATALADAWLAVQIEQLTGAPVPTFGITATDDAERLSSAVATILASDADTTMQLSRMARAEPLDAAQRATAAPILD